MGLFQHQVDIIRVQLGHAFKFAFHEDELVVATLRNPNGKAVVATVLREGDHFARTVPIACCCCH